MIILIFFLSHWFLSLFFQSFFHHRYASHGMFRMSRFWQRTFNLLAFLAQGTSYLNPRAYAIMHRRHHAHSDTELDPHSPRHSGNVVRMMLNTYRVYSHLVKDRTQVDDGIYPAPFEWSGFERVAGHPATRVLFMGGYTAFYVVFATHPWQFLLLPVHFLMGPVHGAIVNWCGHRYGYRNHDELADDSRNTLPLDFLTLGELFQNNHHKAPDRANFAHRFFEIDPVYPIVRLLGLLRIIHGPVPRAERVHLPAP
jgi:stearoyl-CoA desaturase (delta-9 desaturase)